MSLSRTVLRLVPLVPFMFAAAPAFAADEAPKSGSSLAIPVGDAKLGLILQAWGYDDTTAPVTHTNFRMRRAEIKLGGNLNESLRWYVMFDPAKNLSATGDNKVLQDLVAGYALAPGLELLAGQMKIPTTAEGFETSAELLFPERTYVARNYGDRREDGVMLAWKESIYRVNAMVSNGQKGSVDDTNDRKDLSLRADVLPTDRMKFGAFTTAVDSSYGLRSRFGANARFRFDELLVKGEGVIARDSGIGSHGWAVDAGYTLAEKFQPAARWESFDSAGLGSHAATIGLNYYALNHRSKIQAAYTVLRDMIGASGTYMPAAGSRGSLFILCFQTSL